MPSKRDSDKVGSARPENVAGPGCGDPLMRLETGSGGVGGGWRLCVFCCCALRSVTAHDQRRLCGVVVFLVWNRPFGDEAAEKGSSRKLGMTPVL